MKILGFSHFQWYDYRVGFLVMIEFEFSFIQEHGRTEICLLFMFRYFVPTVFSFRGSLYSSPYCYIINDNPKGGL